jgi:hypothetical protein
VLVRRGCRRSVPVTDEIANFQSDSVLTLTFNAALVFVVVVVQKTGSAKGAQKPRKRARKVRAQCHLPHAFSGVGMLFCCACCLDSNPAAAAFVSRVRVGRTHAVAVVCRCCCQQGEKADEEAAADKVRVCF